MEKFQMKRCLRKVTSATCICASATAEITTEIKKNVIKLKKIYIYVYMQIQDYLK